MNGRRTLPSLALCLASGMAMAGHAVVPPERPPAASKVAGLPMAEPLRMAAKPTRMPPPGSQRGATRLRLSGPA